MRHLSIMMSVAALALLALGSAKPPQAQWAQYGPADFDPTPATSFSGGGTVSATLGGAMTVSANPTSYGQNPDYTYSGVLVQNFTWTGSGTGTTTPFNFQTQELAKGNGNSVVFVKSDTEHYTGYMAVEQAPTQIQVAEQRFLPTQLPLPLVSQVFTVIFSSRLV